MGCVVELKKDEVVIPKKALLAFQYVIGQMGTSDALHFLWDIYDGKLTQECVDKHFKDYQERWGGDNYKCTAVKTKNGIVIYRNEFMFSQIYELSSFLATTISVARDSKYTIYYGNVPFEDRWELQKYIDRHGSAEILITYSDGITQSRLLFEEV